MSEDRQTNNIWFYLCCGDFRSLLRIMHGDYFWHDSFGAYINRWILCPLLGHRKTEQIDGENGVARIYCFACGKFVDEEPKP